MSRVAAPNVLLIGTGEYTTGYVHAAASTSDKACGVLALSCFDLRERGLIGPKLGLVGTTGRKFAAIRAHLHTLIHCRYHLDTTLLTFPNDDTDCDPLAYRAAIASHYTAGDIALITTPDATHFSIAADCIAAGMHVMIAKPIVHTLQQHLHLHALAQQHGVLAVGEFHKRYDPLYMDASSRIRAGALGDLSYFHSYMSQPKQQLATFASWLKHDKSSDISYYLNAHHIDFLCNAIAHHTHAPHVDTTTAPAAAAAPAVAAAPTDTTSFAAAAASGHATTRRVGRAVCVVAMGAQGVANELVEGRKSNIYDTITLNVTFELNSPRAAAAAAPAAPPVSASASDSTSASPSASTSACTSSRSPPRLGLGSFTSSWIAPRSDVHSQQRFHFLGTAGEVSIDQAHRGYTAAFDSSGFASLNPLFMRYTPDEQGRFAGRDGYGYRSVERFVEAVREWRALTKQHAELEAVQAAPAASASASALGSGLASTPSSWSALAAAYERIRGSRSLASVSSVSSLMCTAILEAGARSLERASAPVRIAYDAQGTPCRIES